MLLKLMQLLGISCRHAHLSNPFAAAAMPPSEAAAADWDNVNSSSGHYVVCLDCGKRFQYDWSAMRVMW
jgi:hypothetical protein